MHGHPEQRPPTNLARRSPAKCVVRPYSLNNVLGLGEREIAIPFKQLKAGDGKFMLRGATKDALKGLPAFSYANQLDDFGQEPEANPSRLRLAGLPHSPQNFMPLPKPQAGTTHGRSPSDCTPTSAR
jgi:hypothetical protein